MGLSEFVERVEGRRRTVVEYSPAGSSVFSERLAVRNADVVHRSLPDAGSGGFVVVRRDGEFRGALPLTSVERALASPGGSARDRDEAAFQDFMDLFDETVFASYDRGRMLATAREIEDRAWRVGQGTLVAGFQSAAALGERADLYETLGGRDGLDVHVYVAADAADAPDVDRVTVHAEPAPELGDFWVLAFDAGGDDANKCALVGEERTDGEFYGFWTYDPDLVDEIVAYLRDTY